MLARDTMPAPGDMSYIVNTDASTGGGVHWIAAMDSDGHRYFNDPLGHIGKQQRHALEMLHPDAEWADDDNEQERAQKECGVRALVVVEIGMRCGINAFLNL